MNNLISLNQVLVKFKSKWSLQLSIHLIELQSRVDIGELNQILLEDFKDVEKSLKLVIKLDKSYSEKEFALTQVLVLGLNIALPILKTFGKFKKTFHCNQQHQELLIQLQLSDLLTLIENGVTEDKHLKVW